MAMRFPFHIGSRGSTATTDSREDTYVRDLLEQVLLTTPGERVNRPDFGSGLLGMVFSPGGDVLQAALQASVQATLQRWLADLVMVQAVAVEVEDSTVSVTVQYVVQRTQQQQVTRFSTDLASGQQTSAGTGSALGGS
ncbi:MAG: GPW/gp25 family protein [Myxococcales bacterium]|nr:GPW/gp25 family protein [Myxococcales bacterium]